MATQPIDMNEKVIKDSDVAVLEQDTEESADVKLLLDLLQQGKEFRSGFDTDWDKRMEFYKDNQWDTTRANYRANPVMNIIRVTIQSILPILTDARPGFDVIAPEPNDYQFAQQLSALVGNWWDKTRMDQTIIEPLMDSMIYDCGILKVTWDAEANFSEGEIKCDVIDPKHIYVGKETRDFNKNCPWVIETGYKEVGELKRMFPKLADKIKADSQGGTVNSESGIKTDVTLVSPTDQHSPIPTAAPVDGKDSRKVAYYAELWIEDSEVEEYFLEDDINKENPQQKKKYPRGKLITVLPNQKLRLQAIENPYKHGKWPYVRFVDAILPRSFYGEGEAKSQMPTQRLINKTLANIMDYMNLMGNPVWIIESDSGLNPDDITNKSGAVYEVDPGKKDSVKRDIPPPIPQYIIEMYRELMRNAEMISGANDITQGRKPLGVTAAQAIDTLQEASQTRIRLKERNLQGSLSQLGSLVIQLMMQYYREPRVARITGKENQWPEYFEFYIEETPDNKYVMNRKKYTYDKENDNYVPGAAYEQSNPSRGMFDVSIQSGTAMPFAKAQRTNVAFKLHEAQVIDGQELLETLEWPNSQQVLERMQQQQAMMPPPGGEPPPPPAR